MRAQSGVRAHEEVLGGAAQGEREMIHPASTVPSSSTSTSDLGRQKSNIELLTSRV
jgi:hypothetical protein